MNRCCLMTLCQGRRELLDVGLATFFSALRAEKIFRPLAFFVDHAPVCGVEIVRKRRISFLLSHVCLTRETYTVTSLKITILHKVFPSLAKKLVRQLPGLPDLSRRPCMHVYWPASCINTGEISNVHLVVFCS